MRGWAVTLAGLGVNLALGVLYAWSAFQRALTLPAASGGQHLWTSQQASWPHTITVASFAVTMVFAGRLQDRYGPRWVATAGGALIGLGMIVSSLSPARLASATAFPFCMVLGFGLFTGVGIGLAYAAATPAAVKWFSAGKRGLIAGVVVSGFGLSSMFTAPNTAMLIRSFGVSKSFLFLGVVLFAVIAGLSQLIAEPPNGYVPPGSYSEMIPAAGPKPAEHEYTWQQTLRTSSFYLLWAVFACSAFAGLMVLGLIEKTAAGQLGTTATFAAGNALATALALGNGLGRPLAGLVSDRIGRQHTMLCLFAFQAVVLTGLVFVASAPLLGGLVFLTGAAYGANLTVFPVTAFDFFGMKNGGVNYGLVFTAWGVGGLLGWSAATWVFDHSVATATLGASFGSAFLLAAALSAVAVGITWVLRRPDPERWPCPVAEPGTARQA